MWSWGRNKGTKRREQSERDQRNAPPIVDETAFVVPNYRRGAPYSEQAAPTYSDAIGSHPLSEHTYDTIRGQQQVLPYGTYPPAGQAPDKWNGYKLDNYTRSIDQEHVLNGDEGAAFGSEIPAQRRMHPALNPYWYINVPDRIQRAPDLYSFIRKFDQHVLGKRRLSGDHFSQGQTVTDQATVSLQGMVAPLRRRSTFRMEPIAYGEDTTTVVAASGFSPAPATVVAPGFSIATAGRSFRLS